MTKRNHRLMSIVLSTIFVFVLSIGLSAAPPAEVLKVAKEGLVQMKDGGLPGIFTDKKAAHIHFGFQVFTIKPAALENDTMSTLHGMITPTDVYRFVVREHNNPIALLTVEKLEGKWVVTSIGAKGLSNEVTAISNNWSKMKGYNLRFVRVWEAKADFMEVSKKNDPVGFVPFESARIAMNLSSTPASPDALYYNSEIQEHLRGIVLHKLSKMMELEESVNNQ